jgi:hypothetical protein
LIVLQNNNSNSAPQVKNSDLEAALKGGNTVAQVVTTGPEAALHTLTHKAARILQTALGVIRGAAEIVLKSDAVTRASSAERKGTECVIARQIDPRDSAAGLRGFQIQLTTRSTNCHTLETNHKNTRRFTHNPILETRWTATYTSFTHLPQRDKREAQHETLQDNAVQA